MSLRPEKQGQLAAVLDEGEPRRSKRLSPDSKRTRGKAPLPEAMRRTPAPPQEDQPRNYAPLWGGFMLAVLFPFSAITMICPQWTGSLGQVLEAAIFGLGGSSSLLVPLLVLSFSLHFLLPRHRRPIQMTWAPTLLWFNLVVVAQRMGGQGGRLGSLVDGGLVALIGPVGSWLVTLACLPLCLLAVCRVHPQEAGHTLAAALHHLQDRIYDLLAWLHTPAAPQVAAEVEPSGEWQSEERPKEARFPLEMPKEPVLLDSAGRPLAAKGTFKPKLKSFEDEESLEDDRSLPFDLSPPAAAKAAGKSPMETRPAPPLKDEKVTFFHRGEPVEANARSLSPGEPRPPAGGAERGTPVEPLEPVSALEPLLPPPWQPVEPKPPSYEEPAEETLRELTVEKRVQNEQPPHIESHEEELPEESPVAESLEEIQPPEESWEEEVPEEDPIEELEVLLPLRPPPARSQEQLGPEFLEPNGQLRLFPGEEKPPPPQYKLPPLALLNDAPFLPAARPDEDKSHYLLDALASFGVQASLLAVVRGPAVTRYELQPARGVKVSRFTSLTNDIALALAATAVRIEAPIPGKSAIGIEIPNENTDLVVLKDILASSRFRKSVGMSIALGKDLGGNPTFANLQKMPHLLVAGTTGSGKSVCVNGLILSLMYRFTPRQLQLLMIDPKQVELSIYEGIPHLISLSRTPESKNEGAIICDPKRAALALHQIVELMEYRYGLFAAARVRNLEEYNDAAEDPLPWVVVIIDELADLMMVASKSVETSICRIAQKARAAGIHLVLATQRPSADVITGLIKVNVPSRIAFAVSSQVDSRVILDTGGAEQLLGKGDMLFCPVDASDPRRLQGCYVTNEEILRVVEWWKAQSCPENLIQLQAQDVPEDGGEDEEGDADDALVEQALQVVLRRRQASASLLQTELKVGYARARRLVYLMEKKGYIGPAEGSKPRKILYAGGPT